MPRNPGTGIYTKPYPDVISDTTIESTVHNGEIADIETDLNTPRPIVAGGTGANNATQARVNLKAEVAAAQVTNYDSHVWESGSFFSNTGSTSSPNDLHAFVGTAQVYTTDYITLQARDVFDTTSVPGRVYVREKKAGVWGPWTTSSVGVVGGITGIGGAPSDMYFGLRGTAPDSLFTVNNKGDGTGEDLFTVTKPGLVLINNSAADVRVQLDAAAGYNNDLYFSNVDQARFLLRNDGNNFSLFTFNDAGAVLATALSTDRLSGRTTVPEPTAAGHITTKNYVDTTTVSLAGDVMTGGLEIGGAGGLVISGTGGLYCANTFIRYSTGVMASATVNAKLQVESNAVGDAAYMAFVRTGTFAGALGIDTDNALKYGGWSNGASAWRIIHEGLNSITLGGDVYIRADAGYSRIIFTDASSVYKAQTGWDGNDVYYTHSGGGSIRMTFDGRVNLGAGFYSRAGISGAYGGNIHNFTWVSSKLQAYIDTSNVGDVTIVSDYRIKKDVKELPSMWDIVKDLRPISYTQAQYTPLIEIKSRLDRATAEREQATKDGREAKPAAELEPMFAADDIERWGFIAHELQATTVESAATGYKDAPDIVQSPNPFTLIAALTKALQEAMARIEALEAAQATP
jgi:hypothetical protein